jgi:hypothetical protein
VLGDGDVKTLSTGVAENDHDVEKPERAGDNDEHIPGGDAVDMIPQKGPPSRGGGLGALDHVLGHRGLADSDPELEEFTVNARRTRQRIGSSGGLGSGHHGQPWGGRAAPNVSANASRAGNHFDANERRSPA